MPTAITRDELQAKLAHGPVVLVEALGPVYYEGAHLPGALNIPHDQVDELATRLLPDLAAEIVVYCASTTCQNSEIAARRLETLGYTNVSDYVDGKADWIEADLSVETGAAVTG